MAEKRYKLSFNDGLAILCRDKGAESSFAARRGPQSREDLAELVQLKFRECSCRAQDLTFASQEGFALSRKIRTPLPAGVELDTACYCLIQTMLYRVSALDRDRAGQTLYLYLEEVRKLAG